MHYIIYILIIFFIYMGRSGDPHIYITLFALSVIKKRTSDDY